jgi:ABC-2 type transport system permease protein
MWLVSGVFFSYERFPEAFWPWVRALPLTALNDALRAIINDGETITNLGRPVVVLGAWGVLTFGVALRAFRWQ